MSSRNNKAIESVGEKPSNKDQGKQPVDQYRDINKKFEFIRNHINSKKSSPNHDKSQNNQSYRKQDTSWEQNKQNKSSPSINKNEAKGLNQQHIESSGNTFNENHFESHLESSPDHNATDAKHVKSFTFEPEDLHKNSIEERAKGKQKRENFEKGKQSNIPQLQPNSITNSLQLNIPPSNPQVKLEKKSSVDSSKDRKQLDVQELKKSYEEKIIALQNELDEKEEKLRKEMMEKDLQLRNQMK